MGGAHLQCDNPASEDKVRNGSTQEVGKIHDKRADWYGGVILS